MKRYLAISTVFLTLFFAFSGVAIASCHLDGTIYDEGEVVSGYVCKDGDWVRL